MSGAIFEETDCGAGQARSSVHRRPQLQILRRDLSHLTVHDFTVCAKHYCKRKATCQITQRPPQIRPAQTGKPDGERQGYAFEKFAYGRRLIHGQSKHLPPFCGIFLIERIEHG